MMENMKKVKEARTIKNILGIDNNFELGNSCIRRIEYCYGRV